MQENRFGWDEGDVVWDLSDAEEWAKEHDRIEAMAAKQGPVSADADEDDDDEDGEWWRKHLEPHREKVDSSAVLDGFCRKAVVQGVNPFSSRSGTQKDKKIE